MTDLLNSKKMPKICKHPIDAKPLEEGEEGEILCPHCHKDITIQYENGLDIIDSLPPVTIKDPCFSECSSSQTFYLKCPYCFCAIEDELDWDN